jgi:hypothetical protein
VTFRFSYAQRAPPLPTPLPPAVLAATPAAAAADAAPAFTSGGYTSAMPVDPVAPSPARAAASLTEPVIPPLQPLPAATAAAIMAGSGGGGGGGGGSRPALPVALAHGPVVPRLRLGSVESQASATGSDWSGGGYSELGVRDGCPVMVEVGGSL